MVSVQNQALTGAWMSWRRCVWCAWSVPIRCGTDGGIEAAAGQEGLRSGAEGLGAREGRRKV